LGDDPAVIGIAEELGIPETYVVGLLHKLWSWASCQTIDGNAPDVTFSFVDRYVSVTGFAQAVEHAGWLERNGAGLSIPKFNQYNSESAKTRARTRIRTRKSRNAASVTKRAPREEKRREENCPKCPPQKTLPSESGKRTRPTRS
jgi:hypothetical protein